MKTDSGMLRSLRARRRELDREVRAVSSLIEKFGGPSSGVSRPRNGRQRPMGANARAIIEILSNAPGRVMARDELLHAAAGEKVPTESARYLVRRMVDNGLVRVSGEMFALTPKGQRRAEAALREEHTPRVNTILFGEPII